MSLLDRVFWSIRQFRERLLESILIILGIGLGVAVICGVIGLIEGYDQQFAGNINSTRLRTFIVSNYQGRNDQKDFQIMQRTGTGKKKTVQLYYQDYKDLAETEIPNSDYIWFSNQNIQRIVNYQNKRMMVTLTIPEIFNYFDFELVDGYIFSQKELEDRKDVVVLGQQVADTIFGDEDPIGQDIMITGRTTRYKVIGVVKYNNKDGRDELIPGIGQEKYLENQIYMPYFSLYKFKAEDEIRNIIVLASEDADLNKFNDNLRSAVDLRLNDGLYIHGWFKTRNALKVVHLTIGKIIGIFATVALLVAAINILNLMMARVLRRYKNIGISTALGASKRDIFNLFLTEAFMLGLLGSLIGILLANGSIKILTNIVQIPIKFSLFSWTIGIGSAIIVSLIFGVYPASQAAKTDAVDALTVE